VNLEARLWINGRVHQVRNFVYYFPECLLVIKRRRFQREPVPDLRRLKSQLQWRLEFQLQFGPGDWRSIQINEVTWE
jgi:hypothetical protein